jgi:hypothetical protein
MKFTALVAAVAAQATQGADCSANAFICQNTATTCVSYTDSSAAMVSTCQDCLADVRTVSDSLGQPVMFSCVDDGASTLYATAAALLAAATLMA